MLRSMLLRSSALALGLLTLQTSSAFADSIFNFESTPARTALPITLTSSGLSATFTGSASVCNSGGIFATLSGNVLIQGLCSANTISPLTISFSQTLSALSFDFATAGGPSTLNVSLFENGTSAGTASFMSADPAGHVNGEGLASLSGTFNSVVLSGADFLAADNLDAKTSNTPVPEPAAIVDCATGSLVLLGFLRRSRRLRPRLS